MSTLAETRVFYPSEICTKLKQFRNCAFITVLKFLKLLRFFGVGILHYFTKVKAKVNTVQCLMPTAIFSNTPSASSLLVD